MKSGATTIMQMEINMTNTCEKYGHKYRVADGKCSRCGMKNPSYEYSEMLNDEFDTGMGSKYSKLRRG